MPDVSLFADRKENFERLRMAVAKIDGIREAERGDLIRLIENIEVKTIRDGKCHLTRHELYEALHWSKNTFDRRRKLAEQLGWITVERFPQSRGGQGANKWQVNWIRIRNDSQKPTIFLSEKLGNRLPCEGNRLPCEGNRIPTEGNRVEDARARHPIKNPIQNPINHEKPMGDGNGFYKNSSGGWSTPITVSELRDPQAIERRYREAVERFRDFVHSESNRIRFFGLARDAVTNPNVKSPPAWFTGVLKRGSVPTDAGCEWARQTILELHRQKQRPAAMAAEVIRQGAFLDPSIGSRSKDPAEEIRKLAKAQGYTGR